MGIEKYICLQRKVEGVSSAVSVIQMRPIQCGEGRPIATDKQPQISQKWQLQHLCSPDYWRNRECSSVDSLRGNTETSHKVQEDQHGRNIHSDGILSILLCSRRFTWPAHYAEKIFNKLGEPYDPHPRKFRELAEPQSLYQFSANSWRTGEVPKDCKRADLVSV